MVLTNDDQCNIADIVLDVWLKVKNFNHPIDNPFKWVGVTPVKDLVQWCGSPAIYRPNSQIASGNKDYINSKIYLINFFPFRDMILSWLWVENYEETIYLNIYSFFFNLLEMC